MDKKSAEQNAANMVAEFEHDKAASDSLKRAIANVVRIGKCYTVAVEIPTITVYCRWLADRVAVEIEEAISKIACDAAAISGGGVESASKTLRRIQAETAQASAEVDG